MGVIGIFTLHMCVAYDTLFIKHINNYIHVYGRTHTFFSLTSSSYPHLAAKDGYILFICASCFERNQMGENYKSHQWASPPFISAFMSDPCSASHMVTSMYRSIWWWDYDGGHTHQLEFYHKYKTHVWLFYDDRVRCSLSGCKELRDTKAFWVVVWEVNYFL